MNLDAVYRNDVVGVRGNAGTKAHRDVTTAPVRDQ